MYGVVSSTTGFGGDTRWGLDSSTVHLHNPIWQAIFLSFGQDAFVHPGEQTSVKFHLMYELIRTSSKYRWSIYRTSGKCRWSIYRTSRKRRGTFGSYRKAERSSPTVSMALRWIYHGRDGVSNHHPHECLLNRLFRRRKENIQAPRHWPLYEEFTGTGEFPAQLASNAENASIWWRHHGHVKDQTAGKRTDPPNITWEIRTPFH